MIDFINVGFQYTGKFLFQNANFRVNKEDKIGLVGLNGSGKTTILTLIARDTLPTEGEILKRKKLSVGYLPQEYVSFQKNTLMNDVRSSITEVNEIDKLEARLNYEISRHSTTDEYNKLISKLSELTNQKERIEYYSIKSKIEKVLMGLGFKPDEFNKQINEFSGGWQMRIELAKILLQNNDVLLLDEPTNHLDIDSLRWLIEYLMNFTGAII
ncbi:ATP-binding cassette domain-containing protein, partial [Bacteroidota bacterium]